MSHRTTCSVCLMRPCECEESDAWLYRDTPADLTPEQFLQWHQRRFGDEQYKLEGEGLADIPWRELVQLAGIIISVLGLNHNPEDVARKLLPYIRRKGE